MSNLDVYYGHLLIQYYYKQNAHMSDYISMTVHSYFTLCLAFQWYPATSSNISWWSRKSIDTHTHSSQLAKVVFVILENIDEMAQWSSWITSLLESTQHCVINFLGIKAELDKISKWISLLLICLLFLMLTYACSWLLVLWHVRWFVGLALHQSIQKDNYMCFRSYYYHCAHMYTVCVCVF